MTRKTFIILLLITAAALTINSLCLRHESQKAQSFIEAPRQ